MTFQIIKFDKSADRPRFDLQDIDDSSPLWSKREHVVFTEVHAGYMITRIENIFNAKRAILKACAEVAHSERQQLEQDASRLESFEVSCHEELRKLDQLDK